jgi:hypothetical protein
MFGSIHGYRPKPCQLSLVEQHRPTYLFDIGDRKHARLHAPYDMRLGMSLDLLMPHGQLLNDPSQQPPLRHSVGLPSYFFSNLGRVATLRAVQSGLQIRCACNDKPVDGSSTPSRAWAFQGRLLSQRVVHFSDDELYWECMGSVIYECAAFYQAPPRSGRMLSKHERMASMGQSVFYRWCDTVSQYADLATTYESDIFTAPQGLVRVMQEES